MATINSYAKTGTFLVTSGVAVATAANYVGLRGGESWDMSGVTPLGSTVLESCGDTSVIDEKVSEPALPSLAAMAQGIHCESQPPFEEERAPATLVLQWVQDKHNRS